MQLAIVQLHAFMYSLIKLNMNFSRTYLPVITLLGPVQGSLTTEPGKLRLTMAAEWNI
jgi:hypothetical protein